ncbi:hypothetical protein ACMFMF_001097 [Clarireedia jacksonii]
MIIGIFFSIHLTRDFWIPCPLRIFVAASQIVPGLGSPFMIHTFFFRQLALAADYSTERFFALVGGHLRASEESSDTPNAKLVLGSGFWGHFEFSRWAPVWTYTQDEKKRAAEC